MGSPVEITVSERASDGTFKITAGSEIIWHFEGAEVVQKEPGQPLVLALPLPPGRWGTRARQA